MPIERVAIEQVPGWGVPPKRKFVDAFREVAEALRDSPIRTAIKLPIQDLTNSKIRGDRISRSLRSTLQRHVVKLGLNRDLSSGISVHCDDIYAYFFRFKVSESTALATERSREVEHGPTEKENV